MKQIFAKIIIAGLISTAYPATASAAYLFGLSPTGSQTLTINGSTVIQASQMGWFDANGEHIAGNTNYFVADADYGGHRNFFGFDLSNINGVITTAVLDIGNERDGGFLGTPLVWRLFDIDEAIDSSLNYMNVGIWSDLGSGTSYGEVAVGAPTSNVSLTLNSDGLNALNRSVGKSFYVGGATAPAAPAVPEPTTWLTMILGFAFVGGALRLKRGAKLTFQRTGA